MKSKEVVAKAMELYSNGTTPTDIASQLGLCKSTVCIWVSRHYTYIRDGYLIVKESAVNDINA